MIDMKFFRDLIYVMISVLLTVVMASCNRDEELSAGCRPVIEFDHEDGIYQVMVGEELTLSPVVENGDDADYQWTLDDGTVVCRQRVWTSRWDRAGEYYAVLTVANSAGWDREEVRIDVTAPLPPAISLALPPQGLTLMKGADYLFEPVFGNVPKGERLAVEWFVDGERAGDGESFVFNAGSTGTYNLIVRATNTAGTSEKEFNVTVVDELPVSIGFMPLSYYYRNNVRYTVTGRPVALTAIGGNVSDGDYRWRVDGADVLCSGPLFVFVPETSGSHVVDVEVRGAVASMRIEAVADAGARSGASYGATVVEYVPAPGQFIGETSSVGGMTPEIKNHQAAAEWANGRFGSRKFVSLGAWGGYLIARFDRSVRKKAAGYDFAVMGNAITTSNEPGIVWVMQDVNGNGLPDDEWYQLRGSDFSGSGVSHSFSVMYYRPAGDDMDVQWTDGTGGRGTVDYIGGTHNQPCYYPAWIDADTYELYGSRLPARNSMDPVSGMWSNNPFEWGYADNIGSDLMEGDTYGGGGVWTGFRISNAVLPDGTPVSLDFVDFVKVQTGVMAKSGRLGELSTEVCGIKIL